jgi:hypothetical protein
MHSRSSMPEFLLQRVWRDHRHFLTSPLKLRDGTELTIHEPGTENTHRGGPDFLNASIEIAGVRLSGDVELHTELHLWDNHGHTEDSRYGKVILHVVLHDEDEETSSAVPKLPTLVIGENLAFDKRELWEQLFHDIYDRSPELPCFPHNLRLPLKRKMKVIDRFGESRLNDLVDRFKGREHHISEQEFLERVYAQTLDALGFSENRKPFGEVARLLPLDFLRSVALKWSFNDRSAVFEALFFGVAGLLEKPSAVFTPATNEHIIELQSHWESIQVEVRIPEVLAKSDWAFFRIRPLNSPHRRVALAAALGAHLFSQHNYSVEHPFFVSGPEPSFTSNPFWESHTSFGVELEKTQGLLGIERSRAIMLNVLLPARIAWALQSGSRSAATVAQIRKRWGDTTTKSSARYINLVEQELLESECVKTVRSEQGALLMTREFCFKGRCRECPLGEQLIQTGWQPR